jgi:hypothetical protein
VDELIVASAIYDHAARLRSYEILANLTHTKGRNCYVADVEKQ